MDCAYEVRLVRDTEDYRIKPHPDGLNKIVTVQLYCPRTKARWIWELRSSVGTRG